jgi:hypothetical protein
MVVLWQLESTAWFEQPAPRPVAELGEGDTDALPERAGLALGAVVAEPVNRGLNTGVPELASHEVRS